MSEVSEAPAVEVAVEAPAVDPRDAEIAVLKAELEAARAVSAPAPADDKVKWEGLPPVAAPEPGSAAPEGGVVVPEARVTGVPKTISDTLIAGIRRVDY